jgi:hypothetical protein
LKRMLQLHRIIRASPGLFQVPLQSTELWKEYQVGTGGYKAAKNFTVQERGADNSKYYRWNVFWTKVSESISAGYSSDQACELIYRCYGAVGTALSPRFCLLLAFGGLLYCFKLPVLLTSGCPAVSLL